MSELSFNQTNLNKPQQLEVEKKDVSAETSGVIASSTPSPLFNVAPSAETGGSIASNSSSSSSSGTNYVC